MSTPLPRSAALLGAFAALALAGAVRADPADDCRDRDIADAARLPLCTAAIEAAADPADRADLLLWRGAILSRQGDMPGALADFDAAEALAPAWAEPVVERAYALWDAAQPDAALAELARARALEPGSTYAFQASLDLLADAGRPGECLDLAGPAIALDPQDPAILASVARCQQDAGLLDEALLTYRDALKLGSEEAHVRSNIALLHLDRGEPEAALPHARAAVALDPSHAAAQRNLATALADSGDLDGALAAQAEAWPLLGAEDEGMTNAVAWRLLLAGRAEEGLPLMEAWMAAAPEPRSADAIDTYAHLLAATGRAGEAAEAFLLAAKAGGPGRREGYEARLSELGFPPERGLRAALEACAATGAACRLSD